MLDLSLNNLKKALLVKEGLSDSRLVNLISELNNSFTKQREAGLNSYHVDQALVSAYTLFYLPTNFPKLQFLLNQLSEEVRAQIKKLPFIDVGTGPGTFLLSYLDYFGEGELYAHEQSFVMIEQAEKLLNYYFPQSSVQFVQQVGGIKDAFLFFGHSLNEMGTANASKLIASCQPRAIGFIEPGTQESFLQVIEMREKLLAKGYKVHYPCPSQASCPIGQGDWCHQVLRFKGDKDLERISQMAKRDRRSLPMIAHLYLRAKCFPDSTSRVVRFFKETKHSLIYLVCDEKNQLQRVELVKKLIPKHVLRHLSEEAIGLSIQYEVIKVTEQTIRAKLLRYGKHELG